MVKQVIIFQNTFILGVGLHGEDHGKFIQEKFYFGHNGKNQLNGKKNFQTTLKEIIGKKFLI